VPWTKTYFSLFDAFRNLENNNFNGTLAIENISSLKIMPDGSDKRHLKYINITNNNISNVEYDDVDIFVVITSIM